MKKLRIIALTVNNNWIRKEEVQLLKVFTRPA
jgi:hypothetical protein